ncbi:tetratricopeptide (TPR) repeat protein [Pedobacter africanus]|uniref:RagB/SusD family nutrient uptake outer membrane protein n=1 Tax=Pedobacter africanus TaxID=151894 RepID=UPI003394953D
MKNYKHKISLTLKIIVFSLILSSCQKDWFDVKSDKSLAVPKTIDEFEYLMDNVAVMNSNTPGLGEIGSDGHYTPDAGLIRLGNNSNAFDQFNAYTWSNTYAYTEVKDWNESYNRVFICNLVLDGLDKIKLSNDAEQVHLNSVRGNALFHRAINYYQLSQVYIQPYKVETAKSESGLPLKEGVDITETSKRSSVQQTYDQIINDLFKAIDLLPVSPSFLTRGSKTSAFALLARIYLSMRDYENAGRYANMCLDRYSKLMDYNDIPEASSNLGLFNVEVLFHSTIVNWPIVYVPSVIFIDPDFYQSYENADMRKSRFFRINADGIITFKGMYNRNSIQFSGIAVDEIYLIRAECFARAGNVSSAMNDLNTLMKKRWNINVPYPTFTAIDPNDALKQILEERKKELLLRGIRWSDLRRLNQEAEYQVTLTRTVLGKTYKLEPNNFRYTLPLPKDVLDLSDMQQNPGW